MEAKFAEVPRLSFEATHCCEDEDPWTFRLTSPQPAEKKYLEENPLDQHTNMALARLLEILPGTDKRTSFNMTKPALLAAVAAG